MKTLINRFRVSGYWHLNDEWFYDLKRWKSCRLTPHLFIVGAQKCGTSSLHQYLNAHPDIFMSSPLKEPGYYVSWPIIQAYYKRKNVHFKNRTELLIRGMLSGFSGQKIIGESSTFYSNGDHNISEDDFLENGIELQDVRIIYLIRDPIARITSHYLHAVRNNKFIGDVNNFVVENPEAIRISCFGRQIASYASYLDPKQIHILEFENLINSPQDELNKIYEFLSIPSYKHSAFGVFNAAPTDQATLRSEVQLSPASLNKISIELKKDLKILSQFYPVEKLGWRL